MLEGGRIVQVLERFYGPLIDAINNPSSIKIGTFPYPYMVRTKIEPVRMLRDEVKAWDESFDLSGKVQLAAEKSLAVIPTNVSLAELDKVVYDATIRAARDKADRRGEQKQSRNLSDSVLYAEKQYKFARLGFEDREFFIQPYASFERSPDGNKLQAATLQLKIFVFEYGRLAVTVPTALRHGRFPSKVEQGSVVAPYEPIDVRLSFNTAIDNAIENMVEVDLSTDSSFRMGAKLNNPDMSKVKLPYDSRAELFFAQIARFLKLRNPPRKSTLGNLFQTEGRTHNFILV